MGVVLVSVSQDWVEDNEYKKCLAQRLAWSQCSISLSSDDNLLYTGIGAPEFRFVQGAQFAAVETRKSAQVP